jgi:energy-converting hydrogenase Eha subunit A
MTTMMITIIIRVVAAVVMVMAMIMIMMIIKTVLIIMKKEKPTKCIFKVNHIFRICLAPKCFGAAGAPSSGSPKDPDEIVRLLRNKQEQD